MIIWDIYSFCYDSLLTIIPYKRLIEKMLFFLDAKPGEKILDVGCGTGNLEYLNDISEVNFYCLDFSDSMIRRAKRKNPHAIFKKYNILEGKLPFSENFFDKVAISNVLYIVNDLDKFFADVIKKIKTGGIIVITNSTTDGFAPVIKEHFSEMRAFDLLKNIIHLPMIFVIIIINIIIDRVDEHHFYKEDIIEREMTKAGFQILDKETTYGGINVIIRAKKVI